VGVFFLIGCLNVMDAQEASQWRGANRDGIFPDKNLLTKWPKGGPTLLWSIENLPKGFSSVSIANGMIYTTGYKDSVDVLVAMDMNGTVKWQKPYGKAWTESFPESRCTPTINGNWVYVSSSIGVVACFNALTGDLRWKRKASEEYKGLYGRWGLAESLLVYADKVFFTTGGDETTMIAFDKTTGKTIWITESLKDEPSYTSPLLIDRGGKKIVVNVTTKYIFGVNVEDGKILWKFDFGVYAEERNNNTNTPIYADGSIYLTSGYNHKSIKLKLTEDGMHVTLMWAEGVLDNHIGGVVKVGDYIYGSNWKNNSNGDWVCLDWNTGAVMYDRTWINKGSIIYADGMLYCFEEKSGNIALVKATPEDFKVISSFKVRKGGGPYYAHPVINNGILYIRHGEALMAYSIGI